MHVVIVGAGTFGASLAWGLARAGEQVTLVDQFEPGDRRATSGGESRLIRSSHGADPDYTAMAWRARTLWRELEAESGEELMLVRGVAWFAHTEDGWDAAWDGLAPLELPTGETLRLDPPAAFAAPVALRTRVGGERLRLPGRTHRSELKHVLQDLGVPPWLRSRLPLLFAADGELLAAGDVAISATLRDWLDAHAACLRLD